MGHATDLSAIRLSCQCLDGSIHRLLAQQHVSIREFCIPDGVNIPLVGVFSIQQTPSTTQVEFSITRLFNEHSIETVQYISDSGGYMGGCF